MQWIEIFLQRIVDKSLSFMMRKERGRSLFIKTGGPNRPTCLQNVPRQFCQTEPEIELLMTKLFILE